MESVWFALIGGVLAFPHCLGMCGGFAVYLAAGQGRQPLLVRQLLWHFGRIVTYVFLGAIAGYLGRAASLADWSAAKDLPGYIAGVVMILMGAFVLGLLPTRARGAEGGGVLAWLGQLLGKPSGRSALMLGLVNGLLPCPITLGFLALAAAGTSAMQGMLIMAAMGAGTIWSLLVLGLAGRMLFTPKLKRWGAVATGVVLIAMGSWTVLRKAHVLPPIPGLQAPAQPTASGCREQ